MNLDELLKALAAQEPPATPSDLRREVWLRIAQRKGENRGWFAQLQEMLRSWQSVTAALSLALLVGWVAGQSTARLSEYNRQARAALYLEVFSPQAPGSPAKLIAFKP